MTRFGALGKKPLVLAMPWRTQPRVTPSAYARRLRHQRLGSLNRGLGLHLKRLLNTGWPGAEAVFDLLIPDSFDVALRFGNHRLGLKIAVGVDLAGRDGSHGGVHRFGIKLRPGKRKF